MSEAPAARGKLQLHWKMLIGFLAGLALGLVAHYVFGADAPWVQWLTTYVTQPAGTLFLRLIFMLVIPLLFSALIIGVAEMGDVRSLGRVGWKTLGYTILASGIAVVLGLVLVNWLQPGAGVDPVAAQAMLAQGADRAKDIVGGSANQPKGLDMLLGIVPDNVIKAAADNTILAVMFFSLMQSLPGSGGELSKRATPVGSGLRVQRRQQGCCPCLRLAPAGTLCEGITQGSQHGGRVDVAPARGLQLQDGIALRRVLEACAHAIEVIARQSRLAA